MIKFQQIQLETYHLTPQSRFLLQKPTGTQHVKKFPAFYQNQMFIIVFTRACHWSLSWARCIQSTTSHPISLWYYFPFMSSYKNFVCVSRLISCMHATCPIHLTLDLIIVILFGEAYKLWRNI